MKMKHKRKAQQDRAGRQHAAKARFERPQQDAPNDADDPFHGQTSKEPLDTDFDHEVARRVNGYDE